MLGLEFRFPEAVEPESRPFRERDGSSRMSPWVLPAQHPASHIEQQLGHSEGCEIGAHTE